MLWAFSSFENLKINCIWEGSKTVRDTKGSHTPWSPFTPHHHSSILQSPGPCGLVIVTQAWLTSECSLGGEHPTG